jgi:hypothetical protein
MRLSPPQIKILLFCVAHQNGLRKKPIRFSGEKRTLKALKKKDLMYVDDFGCGWLTEKGLVQAYLAYADKEGKW